MLVIDFLLIVFILFLCVVVILTVFCEYQTTKQAALDNELIDGLCIGKVYYYRMNSSDMYNPFENPILMYGIIEMNDTHVHLMIPNGGTTTLKKVGFVRKYTEWAHFYTETNLTPKQINKVEGDFKLLIENMIKLADVDFEEYFSKNNSK